MNRRILTAALLAAILLVPFAGAAQADSSDFMDKVASILRRVVAADKMDAADARKIYNAIGDKVEAIEEKMEAWKDKIGDWKDKVGDCPVKDDDEKPSRGDDDKKPVRGDDDDDDADDDELDCAKDAFKDAMRKAKLRRKVRARLAKVAARLKKFCDDDDDDSDKADKKWRVAARKCYRMLDDTTKTRLEAYAKKLKTAVANGRITRIQAVRMWMQALKNACAASKTDSGKTDAA